MVQFKEHEWIEMLNCVRKGMPTAAITAVLALSLTDKPHHQCVHGCMNGESLGHSLSSVQRVNGGGRSTV